MAAPAFGFVAAVAPALAFAVSLGAWQQSARAIAGAAIIVARHSDMDTLLLVMCAELLRSHAWQAVAAAWFAALFAGLAASLACGSLCFAPQALVPRLARAVASPGIRRVLSVGNFWPAVFAAASVTLVAFVTLPGALRELFAMARIHEAFLQALAAARILEGVWWRAAAALLIVTALDIGVQRRIFAARLRMTSRELRDERAETEAKPEAKQRRRAVGARRVRSLRIAAIRRATAVIANPTHLAVALRYAPLELDVPTVVARGADLMAAVVRAAARSFDIPIVESPELARVLYSQVEVDEPIPQECYAAVAAVFAWIMRTRGVLRGGDEAAS